jgi:hypothetical protein
MAILFHFSTENYDFVTGKRRLWITKIGDLTAKAAAFRANAPTAAALPFFPPKETFAG